MNISSEQQAEIEALRGDLHETRRPTVAAMEELIGIPFPILDHGFIRVIDYMGDDAAIVQAARVSYGKGTRKSSEDSALIAYLMRHRHTTPFEMCELKIHAKMPIFVARQWVRHRTASINEESGRYSILSNEFHIPTREQMATQSTSNRQGRGKVLSYDEAKVVRQMLIEDSVRAYDHYTLLLNEDTEGKQLDPDKDGLARELARMGLSLNLYTQWYWKVNLKNLFHFLGLRADSHAQYEIRVYADQLLSIVKAWVPSAHDAFLEYELNSFRLSAKAKALVIGMVSHFANTMTLNGKDDMGAVGKFFKESGIPKREWNELMVGLELGRFVIP